MPVCVFEQYTTVKATDNLQNFGDLKNLDPRYLGSSSGDKSLLRSFRGFDHSISSMPQLILYKVTGSFEESSPSKFREVLLFIP